MTPESGHPTAVLCGSFRRDPEALRREFSELQEAGCRILSPAGVDFVDEVEGFVYGQGDLGRTAGQLERLHLRAMERADLIWLHCPDGYVGTSAALELGHAQALGLRIFASEPPEDLTLRELVQFCGSPRAALKTVEADLGSAPSLALASLQAYYARAARQRGWSEETAELSVELLRGEIDELEEAMAGKMPPDIALELADVQLYVVHLANILGIDLGGAVQEKERINTARFKASTARLAA
jgi:NTP pyrophosphatase (non-canonical NTP hydrolase)